MTTVDNSDMCPVCGHANNKLLLHCKNCNSRIEEIGIMRQRIRVLEHAGNQYLENQSNLDAFECFAVLLEYKPGLPKYLKAYCRACLNLGEWEKAANTLNELKRKMPTDPDVQKLDEMTPNQTSEE